MRLTDTLLWGFILGIQASSSSADAAVVADKLLVIQPIQVCSDDGTLCANTNVNLFAAETSKIWLQAGIQVEFLPAQRFLGSDWLDLQTGLFSQFSIYTLAGTPGHGQNPDPKVINLWFVRSFSNGAYGHSLQTVPGLAERNGIGIADSAFSYNGGGGRIDVIAHELGHNLGLDHDTLGPVEGNNLMGDTRSVPATIDDIYPDGNQLDFLNGLQINQARSTSFAVDARLSIGQTTNAVIIAWPASGFTLESASNLTGPWWPVTNQTSPLIVSPPGPGSLFRLRK